MNLRWDLCKSHGALFYLDEAATGFGFSGTFGWLIYELTGLHYLNTGSSESIWVGRVVLFYLLLLVWFPLRDIVFSKASGSGGYRWRRVKGTVFDLMVVVVLFGLL